MRSAWQRQLSNWERSTRETSFWAKRRLDWLLYLAFAAAWWSAILTIETWMR